jgi:predicted porin
MKKLLIASAALAMVAGTAQAQSSVTVYGLVDMGYTAGTNTHTSAAGVSTDRKFSSTGNGDGALATSRLGVRGTEDLGGGLKANFVLEYDLIDAGTGGNGQTNAATTTNGAADFNGTAAAAAAGFGARYSWVGLQDAKLGELRLGRQEQSIHSVMVGGSAGAANNVTGAIYSAGLGSVSTNDAGIRPHNVFVNRAVTYISPAFNGFRVELQTASQELETVGTAPTKASENGGSLKYSAGKLSVAYAMAVSSTVGAGVLAAKSEQQAIAASYDLGVAKLFALSSDRKNSNAGALFNQTKATEIGVQVPRGKTTLWASAYDGSRDGSVNTSATVSSTAAAADLVNFAKASGDVSGYQVGARYDLSKRTAVYGIYGKQEVKATTGAASGAKIESDALALGVRHSF